MKQLPEKVAEFMLHAPQWYVATMGEEPNTVPMTFKHITPEGTLVIADNFMETTVKNILANGKIAVAAHDAVTMEGYQIKGTAVYVQEGVHFEKMAAAVQEKSKGRVTCKGLVVMTPERIIVTTPGPDNKKEL